MRLRTQTLLVAVVVALRQATRGFAPSRQAVFAGGSWWGGRRCATTALRCSARGRVAKLTPLTAFAPFRQTATSQITKRAARADPSPALLVAPQIAPSEYRLPRVQPGFAPPRRGTTVVAKPRAGRCGRACEAPRSAGLVAARASALRCLTSPRLSERSERSERSEFAAGHETEHRRGVGPQGRPPQWRARTGPPAALRAPTVARTSSRVCPLHRHDATD